MYYIKLEQFEGPLDLLLKFIEEDKLKINEISLALVANHYLEYLNQAENLNLEELADFLTVAAKLILIKSRSLLPNLVFAEEEDNLEKQLKIYKEYYDASKRIEALSKEPQEAFCRLKHFRLQEVKFIPPQRVSKELLKEIFAQVLKNLDFLQTLPLAAIERTINITEKIEFIKKIIFKNISVSFKRLLKESNNKTEMVVSFLAVLELVKQKVVTVKQDNLFEEIYLQKL